MASSSANTNIIAPQNQGAIVGINHGIINNHLPKNDDNQKDAKARLFLTDPDVDRSNLLIEKGDRVPGTCEWILQHQLYQQWINTPSSSSLWLTGGPGKGKTMLTLHVTRTLLAFSANAKNITVLYFFCNDRSENQNNAVAVLRGLLYQFVRRKPHLEEYCVEGLGKDNYLQTLASFGALWGMFVNMIEDTDVGDIFCVLDGVEECEESSRTILLRKLFGLFSDQRPTRTATFKLFGASREIGGVNFTPDRNIQMDFINSQPTQADIIRFIDHKLQKLASVEDFKEIEEKVRKTLLGRANGTFLWIGLMINRLEEVETVDEILDILEATPLGLRSLYHQMLSRIKKKPKDALEEILRWLLVAGRPLTLNELATALDYKEHRGRNPEKILGAYIRQCRGFFQTINGDHIRSFEGTPNSAAIYHPGRNPRQDAPCIAFYDTIEDRKRLEQRVAQHSVSRKIEYIQRRPFSTNGEIFVMFSHQSMREFFLGEMGQLDLTVRNLQLNEQELQWHAAQKCLDYLAHSILTKRWVCFNLPDIKRQFPFLGYASLFWITHARKCSSLNMGLHGISNLLLQPTNAGATLRFNWLLSYYLHHHEANFLIEYTADRNDLPLLDLACRFDLMSWVEQLVSMDMPQEEREKALRNQNRFHNTPLIYAIGNNNIALVQILLERGASPSFVAFAKLLQQGREGIDMLKLIIRHGDVNIPMVLREDGVPAKVSKVPNSPGVTMTPLLCAICSENWEAAELLLDSGAQIQAQNLHQASLDFSLATGRASLDFSLATDRASLVLSMATDRATPPPGFLRRLLQFQPYSDNIIAAAAALACRGESNADASLLVLLEAFPMEDYLRRSPVGVRAPNLWEYVLRCAAENGLSKSVKHLATRHGNIAAVNDRGQSAMLLAIGSGHQNIAMFLQDCGAELQNLDTLGGETLRLAVMNKNMKGAELLLGKGVPVNSSDSGGVTPLIEASKAGHVDMILLLLKQGAEVNLADNQGRTSLQHASKRGQVEAVKILVQNQAEVNSTDADGRTALHHAAEALQKDILEFLIRNGGDRTPRDKSGRQYAKIWKDEADRRGKEKIQRELVDVVYLDNLRESINFRNVKGGER